MGGCALAASRLQLQLVAALFYGPLPAYFERFALTDELTFEIRAATTAL